MHRHIFASVVIGYLLIEVNSLIEFTNVICKSVDRNFTDFEYCRLERVNKNDRYITAKVLLFKKPVSSVRINAALYKRSNSYKPYLYNVTVDGCKFLKNRKAQPIARLIYDFLNSVSNINHTCPIDHDLHVHHLTADYLNKHLSRVFSFPKGDYLFQMDWFAYDIKRAEVKFYLSLK